MQWLAATKHLNGCNGFFSYFVFQTSLLKPPLLLNMVHPGLNIFSLRLSSRHSCSVLLQVPVLKRFYIQSMKSFHVPDFYHHHCF